MSSGSSFKRQISKEQAPLKCQLCEKDEKVEWKCNQCGSLICKNCKEVVHPKLKPNHTVINIKEVRNIAAEGNKLGKSTSDISVNLTKLKCSEHPSQASYHFCKSCNRFVCAKCVAGDHRNHDFVDIESEYTTRLNRLKVAVSMVESKVTFITKRNDDIKKHLSMQRRKYNDIKDVLSKHEKKLIETIKQKSQEVTNDLEASWNTLMQERNKLESDLKAFCKLHETINEIVEFNDTEKVFYAFESILNNCEKTLKSAVSYARDQEVDISSFKPGNLSLISEFYGKLEYVPMCRDEAFKVVQCIETELDIVKLLVSKYDDSLWVNNTQNTLQNATVVDESLHIKSEVRTDLGDMAYQGSGKLLLSVKGSSVLKLITPNKPKRLTDSKYSVAPMIPLAVHVTHDNRIIVGTAEGEDMLPVKGPRQIVVMDTQGRIRQVFEIDKNMKPLFSVPARVTSNSLNNIAVIDIYTTDMSGRVVVLDQLGNVLNVYTGHPSIGFEYPFKCVFMDLTTSKDDNFLVSENTNHTIHILNYQGDPVSYINTRTLGIQFPYSLSINRNDILYVGCGSVTNESKGHRAKIYALDISDI